MIGLLRLQLLWYCCYCHLFLLFNFSFLYGEFQVHLIYGICVLFGISYFEGIEGVEGTSDRGSVMSTMSNQGAPVQWTDDSIAVECQSCLVKFSITKRRHHW